MDKPPVWISKHIPAGCLIVHQGPENLPSELGDLSGLQDWKFFAHRHEYIPPAICLPYGAQDALTSLLPKAIISLWQNRWIHMSFSSLTPSNPRVVGRVRVYILPQDVNRRSTTPRNELTKAVRQVLTQLEYSPACWNGESRYAHQGQPSFNGAPDPSDGQDASLLSMFNNIPSPDPKPETVSDIGTRETMQCLLESQVSGLGTALYPYQGKSAALMFQRESEPGRIVDPRFRSALDQEGQPWYYDDVTGWVLREPRFYDGLRGGILAEEMGTGKTLICLALILSTKHEPTVPPDPFVAETPRRSKKASLLDAAAATANRSSVPWKPYFEAYAAQLGYEFQNCTRALTQTENRALYKLQNTLVEPRRSLRGMSFLIPAKEVYLSCTTLIIVPNNLVKQWQNEIKKHTTSLNLLVLVDKQHIPPVTELLSYDIILFSETRFEAIERDRGLLSVYCPLEHIQFKRCIIDEGHKLGNRSRSWKSDVMRVIERLQISARWVVTGTPSRSLYGINQQPSTPSDIPNKMNDQEPDESAIRQEREDVQRIGNLAAKYLKVRPWANTKSEIGDSVADWNTYVMHPKQHGNGHDRKDCLKKTLDSLIIRHQVSDISTLLPPVEEKIVLLDGSFQDKLSLNLFSMMIIFNSVQSQRTDMDYFFHERQRKSLLQLVKNLKQASFFGGVFYSTGDIAKALETAQGFIEKKDVPISAEDDKLLRQAISFGKLAVKNCLKDVSNQFHSMPLYVENFPGGNGKSWSLDDRETNGEPVCTDAGLILGLQKFLNPCIDAPTSLQLMIDGGRLDQQGEAERSQSLAAATDAAGGTTSRNSALAGNTALGDDHHSKPKSGTLANTTSALVEPQPEAANNIEIAEPLAQTKIISTASAKLSYLIDSIVKHQHDEQIIVFYENDNIAYYLAGALEILQIQHLIYTRAGLSANRRAQYVATFTHNPKFRVLLMDISQAAFGLDMRSASRIYFISPVLNPQVEAQAIGRARRISQQKPVTVETLVLRDSIEEIIIDRRKHMTQAEHSKIKTVLDDQRMYEWILDAKIIPMDYVEVGVAQTAMLEVPQFVFGRGFGRELDPDEGLISGSPEVKTNKDAQLHSTARVPFRIAKSLKRSHSPSPAREVSGQNGREGREKPPKRRARIAWADQEA